MINYDLGSMSRAFFIISKFKTVFKNLKLLTFAKKLLKWLENMV